MPLLDLLWTMLMVFLFFAWLWVAVSVLMDIFRSHDLSGWGKAGWTVLIIVLPLLGVLIYLIARGSSMQERSAQDAVAQKRAADDYIRSVAGSGTSTADELAKLATLRDSGVLSDEEYQEQKSRLLA